MEDAVKRVKLLPDDVANLVTKRVPLQNLQESFPEKQALIQERIRKIGLYQRVLGFMLQGETILDTKDRLRSTIREDEFSMASIELQFEIGLEENEFSFVTSKMIRALLRCTQRIKSWEVLCRNYEKVVCCMEFDDQTLDEAMEGNNEDKFVRAVLNLRRKMAMPMALFKSLSKKTLMAHATIFRNLEHQD